MPQSNSNFLRVRKQSQLSRRSVLFAFALATGMRAGEYAGRLGTDLDLDGDILLTLRRAIVRRATGWLAVVAGVGCLRLSGGVV
jgi:hypothetical protein